MLISASMTAVEVKVVGHLAKAVRASDLLAEPRVGARRVSRVEPGRYLVVRPGAPRGWARVVMQDRTLAYLRAGAVKALGYEVTEDKRRRRRTGPLADGWEIARTALEWKNAAKAAGTFLGGGDFVALAYATQGLVLPTSPAEQVKRGWSVKDYEDLREGDRLYFWDAKAKRIGEAGIYLGNGYTVLVDPKTRTLQTRFLDEALQRRTVAARRGGPTAP